MMNGYNGKYKIGDVVRLRSDLVDGKKYGCNVFVSEMEGYKGKPLEIVDTYKIGYEVEYEVEVDDEVRGYNITDEMIAGYWDMFAHEENVGTTIFNSLNNNDNFPKKLKLIDVLNKIANGELKEGTKFSYQNREGVYEDNEDCIYFRLKDLNEKCELIEPQEPTDNTKIEELDENKYILKGMADVVVDTFYKLNEVIKKVNTQTTVLLAQEKDIEDIKEQLDY